jgi:hypothetical protein
MIGYGIGILPLIQCLKDENSLMRSSPGMPTMRAPVAASVIFIASSLGSKK